MITPASWDDLGYRRLGPTVAGDADGRALAQSLATTIDRMVGYEQIDDSGDIWLRDPARRKGCEAPKSLDLVAAFSAAEVASANFDFIDRVAHTPYGSAPFRVGFDRARCREKVAAFAAAPDSPFAVHELSLAFASCPYAELREFVRQDLLSAFFRAYPAGRVLFVSLNSYLGFYSP